MTSSVPARFSAAAATYDRHSDTHETIAARVCELAADTDAPNSILEIGCGTGILTRKLARLFPRASLLAVDVSPRMVEQCRSRLAGTANVEWTVADIRRLPPRHPFDLAAGSASLHWITPVDDAFRAVAALCRPGARFAFAIMLEDTLAELHAARRHVAPHKPVRTRLPTADAVLAALESTGFSTLHNERKRLRAEFLSCAEFLKTIHEQGLTGGPVSSSGTPLARTELKELASRYDSDYKIPSGGVFATYDCLFVLAERT